MKKLRQRLIEIGRKLAGKKRLRGRAERRAKKFHEKAKHNLHVRDEAQANADRARRKRHPKLAEAEDQKALRAEARRAQASAKAQWWMGRLKILTRHVAKLDQAEAAVNKEIQKLGVQIDGNTVRGGTPRERLKAAALEAVRRCSNGTRRNFYSQPGSWTVDAALSGESYGERSDCSQFVTAIYHSAGLPDPNGEGYRGGFTGTLVSNGKEISRGNLQPGDLVVYGSGNGYHVEMYVGPGETTVGHGSPPVDLGTVGMISGYRCFTYSKG